MCIRDRDEVAEFVARVDKEVGKATYVMELKYDGVAISLTSVSYTHLRAHETVLDLVCRLLLEKKTTIALRPVRLYSQIKRRKPFMRVASLINNCRALISVSE